MYKTPNEFMKISMTLIKSLMSRIKKATLVFNITQLNWFE